MDSAEPCAAPTTAPEVPSVTTYGVAGAGGRASSFRLNGCEVLVRPYDTAGDGTETAFELACRLAQSARLLFYAGQNTHNAEQRVTELQAKVPPYRAARLLGRGCVRFLNGRPMLLNSRAEGWGAFGFEFRDWDELFRRWNVRVVESGTDAAGPWWEVENCPREG